MDFDITQLVYFAMTALIPGIVESAKEHFGVQGKQAFLLAGFLGFVFVGLGQAIHEGLIPAWLYPWINTVVMALAGWLAAAGYYDLFLKPLRNRLNGGS